MQARLSAQQVFFCERVVACIYGLHAHLCSAIAKRLTVQLLPDLEHYKKTEFQRKLGKLKGRKEIIAGFGSVRSGFVKSDAAVTKTRKVGMPKALLCRHLLLSHERRLSKFECIPALTRLPSLCFLAVLDVLCQEGRDRTASRRFGRI